MDAPSVAGRDGDTGAAVVAGDGVASAPGAYWAERWRALLADWTDRARLNQGRWHARAGRVVRLDVREGAVSARLQGGQATPRAVGLRFRPLSPLQWERALDALDGSAHYAAALLNGELPEDIEAAFAAAGAELLPRAADAALTCSCSEARLGPCKHIAAVWYVLAERLEADPTLLLTLRGRSKEVVLAGLRLRWGGRAAAVPESAPADARRFWLAPSGAAVGEVGNLGVDGGGHEPGTPAQDPPPFFADLPDGAATLAAAYRAIREHATGLRAGPPLPRPSRMPTSDG